jgi:hypothetical protein
MQSSLAHSSSLDGKVYFTTPKLSLILKLTVKLIGYPPSSESYKFLYRSSIFTISVLIKGTFSIDSTSI